MERERRGREAGGERAEASSAPSRSRSRSEQHPLAELVDRLGNRGLARLQRALVSSSPSAAPLGASSASRPLDKATRDYFEPRFDRDLGGVRIHDDSAAQRATDALGARAVTAGEHVAFGRGQYAPHTRDGRRLIAHELAHVVQQRQGGAGDRGALEADADLAAHGAIAGGRARVAGGARPGVPQFAFVDDVRSEWGAHHDKGNIFDLLRAHGADADPALAALLASMFAAGTDDLWLAQTIASAGPETLWAPAQITDRTTRAGTHHWAPEAGNIAAVLPDPGGAAGGSATITAYFFPGQTAERALVIGGVHGSELSGIDVVDHLRTSLATASAAGNPPYFTTILVPNLVPRAAAHRRSYMASHAFVQFDNEGRTVDNGTSRHPHQADPNRNFPQPGTSLAAARALGATRTDHGELLMADPTSGALRPPRDLPRFPNASQQLLPETRVLLQLIERFQPARIASVHQHWLGSSRGDDPGTFDDPRGGVTAGTDTPATAAGAQDDALTRRMLTTGEGLIARTAAPYHGTLSGLSSSRDPYIGNTSTRFPSSVQATPPYPVATGAAPTVHYTSTAHGEGTSLGGWAPAAGITTVTVEVPQYNPTDTADAARLASAVDLHRDVLQQVFLGAPIAGEPP